MIVGGVHWTSLLDYPGYIAAIVFTAGCNLRCGFCHNPDLVLPRRVEQASRTLDDAFFEELISRIGFLDAVVISGGEPTLQRDLEDVLRRIKRHGLHTKLDTNGTRPELLERLLLDGVLDFVAMDVKAPPSAYARICGVPVDLTAIERSMAVIRRLAPNYEFRTTASPGLSDNDLLAIARWLPEGRAYWLQRFRVPPHRTLVDQRCVDQAGLSDEELLEVWRAVAHRFEEGGVRG